MKHLLEDLLKTAIATLKEQGIIPQEVSVVALVERTKDSLHGDYTTNVAFQLAKPCKLSPLKIAEHLLQVIPASIDIEKIEMAGHGFINFYIHNEAKADIISEVLTEGNQFGCSDLGKGQKVLLEYVSANPTGPLHVGHGRSAAFGSCLAHILSAMGYDVCSEYYINDAGRQMNILTASIWLRYLELAGETIIFPDNAYKGEYVKEIAQEVLNTHGKKYVREWSKIKENLPLDASDGGDKELYIDAVISKAKMLLNDAGFAELHKQGLDSVLDDIVEDLSEFGVHFDNWFSEKSLMEDGSIAKGVQALRDGGHTYEQEGALWFKATAFGDEKDRVLIRANGEYTYFASDVAYHWNKYSRGFTKVIDIFGADHHGYISRIKSAVNALGHDDNALHILLVQFAILTRSGERVQMSTRSGSFVTLRELREEVGNDAARFFYVARKSEQHMEFDLDLAKSESSDNPVYYIQYAHARICSVLKQLKERGLSSNDSVDLFHGALLTEPHEKTLITLLSQYKDVLESAALTCEPHQLSYFLRELANALHSYYNAVTLLCEQESLRFARMYLLKAVRQVLFNGLTLLGVSAPESM
jgi:arginyl-tRNA synthetase